LNQEIYELGNYNLDNSDNMVCVCPECHRALHFGTLEEKMKRLEPLYLFKNVRNHLESNGVAKTKEEFFRIALNFNQQ
ncbi:MAG: hypothetical protein ACRCZJ_09150, partial [Erysipelotrichaceae bacterium]